uniref:Acyl-CoA dehydrogenase n=1 Tax=Acrobeloides nanus TaxID=290746 RepID=A0A914EB01_9BILA
MLDRVLQRFLPGNAYKEVTKDLDRFGDRIINECHELARECENNPPKLEQFDAWGNRVDKLILTPAWDKLKNIAAEEGLISIGYDDKRDPLYRRIHQFSKLYMFSPAAGLTTCPLAMTDGAIKTIKENNLTSKIPEISEAYKRLTSNDPSYFWTSGQWMTEKAGGSDVGGGTDTYATLIKGNQYRLNGYKWFSSAIDANVSLVLARVADKNGEVVKISDEGRGVATISTMLNVTRIYNTVGSCSAMRVVIAGARDYATKRVAFGQKLSDWPLHMATIAKMEVQARASFLLFMESVRLLGKQEAGKATVNELLNLRLMTPIAKLYNAKVAMPLISEGLECFGGQGYIEDNWLPQALRDAQVGTIWEGTTNVLSLDVLRVLAGKENALEEFKKFILCILEENKDKNSTKLEECKKSLLNALDHLLDFLPKVVEKSLENTMRIDRGAREIAFAIAKIYCGAFLISHASHQVGNETDEDVACRFCLEEGFVTLKPEMFDVNRIGPDRNMGRIFGIDKNGMERSLKQHTNGMTIMERQLCL